MMDLTNMKSFSVGGINLKELYINNILMWKSSLLPTGYTQLDYIEATGLQYLDTGITGHNGLSIEMNVMPLSMLNADNSTLIGSTNETDANDKKRMYLTLNKSATPYVYELGASSYYVLTGSANVGKLRQKYNINISWTKAKSVLTVDGTAKITMSNTLNFDDNGTNMYIFARHKGNGVVDKLSHARLYDLKMWSNGTLKRDYIPARRDLDGEVGLYDLVSKTFFKSVVGSFIGGVSLPDGYIRLDYIETNVDSGSWIDTGVNTYTYNDKVLKYNFKGMATGYRVSGGNNYLWGCLDSSKRSGNVALKGTTAAGASLYIGGSSNEARHCSLNPTANTPFEVYVEANSNDDSSVKGNINGTVFGTTTWGMVASQMPNNTIYLGHCNGTTTGSSKGFKGRIYYFSIGTTDGEFIREMIPCINPDGLVGMYDVIGQSFYNSISNAFTAGNAV